MQDLEALVERAVDTALSKHISKLVRRTSATQQLTPLGENPCRIVRASEVARHLGMSFAHVSRMVSSGRLPPWKSFAEGRPGYLESDLVKILERMRVEVPDEPMPAA